MSKSVMELILMVYLDKKIWSYEFAVKGKEKGNKLLSSSCCVPPNSATYFAYVISLHLHKIPKISIIIRDE